MESFFNVILQALEKLLTIINSTRRLLFLGILTLLFFTGFLAHQLLQSQELISEIMSPNIERVGGYCYQQRIRLNARIVGIQFPIPEALLREGVTQNLSALLLSDEPDQAKFNRLCKGLIDEILDPGVELDLLKSNPEWQQRLLDFYRGLDKRDEKPPVLKKEDVIQELKLKK